MSTLKQRDFLESLLFGRVKPENLEIPEDLNELTVEEASKAIDLMLAAPLKKIELGIPDGRYALPAGKRNGKRVFQFYFVNTSKTTGNQYVMQMFGAPGNFRREKLTKAMQVAVAETVAADPAVFSQMFGMEVGSCGVCGSPLTDPESIARGIGPICLKNSGW